MKSTPAETASDIPPMHSSTVEKPPPPSVSARIAMCRPWKTNEPTDQPAARTVLRTGSRSSSAGRCISREDPVEHPGQRARVQQGDQERQHEQQPPVVRERLRIGDRQQRRRENQPDRAAQHDRDEVGREHRAPRRAAGLARLHLHEYRPHRAGQVLAELAGEERARPDGPGHVDVQARPALPAR